VEDPPTGGLKRGGDVREDERSLHSGGPTKVDKAYAAWQKYRAYSQEQVDAIVEGMAVAARAS
jgi:hypothetical protein